MFIRAKTRDEMEKTIRRNEHTISYLDESNYSLRQRVKKLEDQLQATNEDLTNAEVRINTLSGELSALLKHLELEVFLQRKPSFIIRKREDN